MRVPVFDATGKRTSEILEFDENIFGDRVREVVLKEAILMYEARQRRGTHSTKTRSQASGTGRKLWKQKGTGRARTGPSRAPHWKGGGVVFGPHPRDYSYSMPKKARKIAMDSAWLAKFQDKEVIVFESLQMEAPKTKTIYSAFCNMGINNQRVLVGWNTENLNFLRSFANIPMVEIEKVERLNPYLLLANEKVVLVKDAFEELIRSKGAEIKVLNRQELYPNS
jgi:large subunit ribosomal protein L4